MAAGNAVLIGAGKIGRAYLGELFLEEGYRTTLIHHREEFVQGLREQGYYTIRKISHGGSTVEKRITGFEILCSQSEHEVYLSRMIEAEFIGVITFPNAFDEIARDLAAAIRERKERNKTDPLGILLCVNYVFAAAYFENAITAYFSEEEKSYFHRYCGLSECLVVRGGYNPTPDLLEKDAYAIQTGDRDTLPVDVDAFRLGHSYPSFFDLEHNVTGQMVKKIWCGNLQHCCLAYYGTHRAHKYVYQAAQDAYVRSCTHYAGQEANRAVGSAYGFSQEEMDGDIPLRWERYMDAAIKDDLNRVGADPIRKLSRNDRFIGPALLCLQQGILPYFIAKGAALGFLFHQERDQSSIEIQKWIQERGIEDAILHYCQLDRENAMEDTLYQLILSAYQEYAGKDPRNM